MRLQIVQTADGSTTIKDTELNEIYHSVKGAINESMHVYIKAGLQSVEKEFKKLNLLEIGMGTGLNVLLTYQYAQQNNLNINYTTLEPYPVPPQVLQQMNFIQVLDKPTLGEIWQYMHLSDWEIRNELSPGFSFTRLKSKLEDFISMENNFHLVYYDAFAPEIQPEMWQMPMFEKVNKFMKEGGLLVTYTAKGNVRRALQDCGFEVFRIPGPKGKREMIQAVKR